jgi:hypothetical protein
MTATPSGYSQRYFARVVSEHAGAFDRFQGLLPEMLFIVMTTMTKFISDNLLHQAGAFSLSLFPASQPRLVEEVVARGVTQGDVAWRAYPTQSIPYYRQADAVYFCVDPDFYSPPAAQVPPSGAHAVIFGSVIDSIPAPSGTRGPILFWNGAYHEIGRQIGSRSRTAPGQGSP